MVQSLIAPGFLLSTLLVGVLFAYLFTIKRQRYLLFWQAAWALCALYLLPSAITEWVPSNAFLSAAGLSSLGLAGISFFVGGQLYTRKKVWAGPAIGAVGIVAIWAALYAFRIVPVSPVLAAAIIFLVVSYLFWHESQRHETFADLFLGFAFFAWGMLLLALSFLPPVRDRLSAVAVPISLIPSIFVGMLLVVAIYEEEKRRVERNMLALSNLNLATSSFVGGEIQRMLAQALDRVLGVVRLPSGALFLHHGDPTGPTSMVSAGLPDEFCRAVQSEGLDDYLGSLVSRLGGLLGFRDLRDDNLTALEKDEPIRRFRELGLRHGLRSIVVISLQAKEQAFGLLLLGTPDNRRFTQAELRLLLALGHQIGMAVENSYLIQQTSRRSEELHVLNEIGRALSSTLNKEDLLQKIWEELRRLFDVDNLYLASYDAGRDQVNQRRAEALAFSPRRESPYRVHSAHAATGSDPREFCQRGAQAGCRADPHRRLVLRRAAGRLRPRNRRAVPVFRP